MIRVVDEGDAEIGMLPGVVAVVTGAAVRLALGIKRRMALDAARPDGIGHREGLTVSVDGEDDGCAITTCPGDRAGSIS